jgi:hypothetical protein
VDSALVIILIFHYTRIAFIESDCPAGQVPSKKSALRKARKRVRAGGYGDNRRNQEEIWQ